jgi:two-component system, OmpR family, osmolarity sensor histidine kinase EnvZ
MAMIGDLGTMIRRRGGVVPRLVGRAMSQLPKGLYPRSILIVVTPIVVLQSVAAYVFMERHWETTNRRLSEALSRDIAAIIEIIETYPQDQSYGNIARIAADTFGLNVAVLPPDKLPAPAPRPFFSLLDDTLSRAIRAQVGKPFWSDTVGDSDQIEIRIDLGDHLLRVYAKRSQAYSSNTHIFLVWMLGTSLVLISIALLFLRNQIYPILNLARAAEQFGKGRPVASFRPRGAREVRMAAQAFIDMQRRIERQIEQRTTMLSGVSHDLRTVLTRFKLELALLGDTPETELLRADVDEMSRMLEDYLAFVQGDSGEEVGMVHLPTLLDDTAEAARRGGAEVATSFQGEEHAQLRALGFRRCLSNLVDNAAKYADHVDLRARHADGWLTVTVDDDGPGIPASEREAVFRPFYRLDAARNVDAGGSGLGLAIARDIAISHGGDVILADSPLGGLRVVLMIPA